MLYESYVMNLGSVGPVGPEWGLESGSVGTLL